MSKPTSLPRSSRVESGIISVPAFAGIWSQRRSGRPRGVVGEEHRRRRTVREGRERRVRVRRADDRDVRRRQLRVGREQAARVRIEPEVVVRIARDPDLVHGRVEVEADPVAGERGRHRLERRPFGDGDRGPRVQAVDDAGRCRARRGRRLPDGSRSPSGRHRRQAGDPLRADELRRALAGSEAGSRVSSVAKIRPGLVARTAFVAACCRRPERRAERVARRGAATTTLRVRKCMA